MIEDELIVTDVKELRVTVRSLLVREDIRVKRDGRPHTLILRRC